MEETFHKATRLIAAIVDSPDGDHLHVTADKLIENCDCTADASVGSSASTGYRRRKKRLAEIAAAVKKR